jgi:hypothetical protein
VAISFAEPAARPRLWKLDHVRAFATGTARGQTWTEQDLDDIVRNQTLYGDKVKPAVVIGHEEQQPLTAGMPSTVTQNTGEPAFGRVVAARKVYETVDGRRQAQLDLDLDDVPDWLAALIRGKAYSRVSVELYDDPPDGLAGAKGPILRRVAFLGGEIPQVKTLADLPMPMFQYSERPFVTPPRRRLTLLSTTRRGGCSVVTFAETATVDDMTATDTPSFDRTEAINKLTNLGMDRTVAEELSTDALAEAIRCMTSPAAPPDTDGLDFDERLVSGYGTANAAALARQGMDPAKFAEGFRAFRKVHAREFAGSRCGEAARAYAPHVFKRGRFGEATARDEDTAVDTRRPKVELGDPVGTPRDDGRATDHQPRKAIFRR